MTSPVRRLVGGVSIAIALGASAALAPPVSAAAADPVNFAACNNATLSQAFAPWGDPSSYELAPGGEFESAAWTLDGRAQITAGSEPYAASGTLGNSSLSLPAGSSAQSPETCVDAAYPTVRFFIAGTGLVAVNVIDGGLDLPAGVAAASGAWDPGHLGDADRGSVVRNPFRRHGAGVATADGPDRRPAGRRRVHRS